MTALTVKVDRSGLLKLPEQALKELGIETEEEISLEIGHRKAVLTPKTSDHPLTDHLAAMNHPVADWEEMKREIEDDD